MDKAEAKAERARLQSLVDDYEAGRLTQQDEDDRRELKRGVTPIELTTPAPESRCSTFSSPRSTVREGRRGEFYDGSESHGGKFEFQCARPS